MSGNPTAPLTAPGQPADRAISRLQIAILLGSLSFGILEFALPIYARRLGASALDIGGVISIFAVMITVLRPLVGWGSDRWGRKPFLAVSLLFYGLAMVFFGFAQSLGMLYAARLVQGIGSSLFWIPAYTVVTELSTRDWGRAVGSVNMSSSRGGIVGTFVGFLMILSAGGFLAGWQQAFGIYAAAALVGAILIWRFIPETRGGDATSATDEKASGGLDRKYLFRLMLIVLITSASSSMISPLLMIFLQDRFSTDVPTLATAFLPAALVYAFLPGVLGGLSDRFGRAPLMAVGLIGAGVVSLWMPATASILLLAILWVLEAVGLSAASPAEAALVADLAGRNVRGRGYGMYMFATGLGFIVGPLVGGWLYDTAGHALPFYANGVILFIAAALVLLLLRSSPRQPVLERAG
jgi:MFS family permease